MNASKNAKAVDAKQWIQQLKTDRKTQVVAVAFPLVALFLGWQLLDDGKPAARKTVARATAGGTTLNEAQVKQLQRLPNLARLDRAGALPNEDRTYRDPFIFDEPPPKPPPPPRPLPPPPPPTPEQIAALQARQAREAEEASKPAFRYIGYLDNAGGKRTAAFMRGEEAIQVKVGDVTGQRWKLVEAKSDRAVFQNLKYSDLRHEISATDQGGEGQSVIRNAF